MKDENKTKEQLIKELIELRQRLKGLEVAKTGYNSAREMLRSFEKAFETMQLGVTITDLEGGIIYINPADASAHGYTVEELIGEGVRIFAPPKLWNPMALEKVKSIKRLGRESINMRKDGSLFPVQLLSDVVIDEHGEPIYIVTTCEDISERKQTEEELQKAYKEMENHVQERTAKLSEIVHLLKKQIAERKQAEKEKTKLQTQLLQSQKMEAIGKLAGGVAHDFNNILTAIIGYAGLIRMKMKEDDPLRAELVMIINSAERASHLTHGLLAFSRKQVINLKPIELNDLVDKSEKFLLRLISEDIELKTLYTNEGLNIIADSGQIGQVLMNLVTNARDAMPDGGCLTINTEAVTLNKKFFLRAGYDGKQGRYALITVTDTGSGMDKTTAKKIFEPFFTTKEVGKGTGFGLSIVYGIIKQHDGFIDVYSKLGEGTTFKIYLPMVKKRVEKEKAMELPPPKRGTETVMLAEDENEVRELIKIILNDFGYVVVEAVDGENAIKKFKENKDDIQLLIFDVVMPKKNGKEAYEAIKKIKPDIKALFMSGYPQDIINKQGINGEVENFITKPILPDNLLRKIREILDT